MRYDKLRFGTAGTPRSTTGKGRPAGIARSMELGLGAQELEFVHGVNLREGDGDKIRQLTKGSEFAVTAHGPYYVNLNAQEPAKQEASVKRVMDTARALHSCGGTSATFHPAFYLKMDNEKVYENVKKRLKTITKRLQDEGTDVTISPETTGKGTQFGSLNELIRMAQDVEGLGVCVDFAHLHARSNGAHNTPEEFHDTMTAIEAGLGKEHLKRMHIHVSGIAYGEKGEKNHLPLKESDMKWRELLQTLKEFKTRGAVICESPILEDDALLLQKEYEDL